MIDPKLKRALGQAVKGVEVVAATHDGVTRAYTSHWVTQVSFAEPVIMASVSPKHDTYPLMISSGAFTVSFLAGDLTSLDAAGAVEIGSFMELPHFTVERAADGSVANPAAVEAYLATVRKAGIKKNRIAVLSAHQMGTARMGATPRKGAVDGSGESWDVSGLCVADGAAFPTSSGVNPMMSIEAIGYMVAEAAAQRAGKTVPPPAGGAAEEGYCTSGLASSVAGGRPPVKRGPVKVEF